MSMQAMASFVEKAQSDEALAGKLVEILGNNEGDEITSKVIVLAKENGFEITASDVEETRRQFEQFADADEGELTDGDLENVAGGVVAAPIAAAAITGAGAVTAAGVRATGDVTAATIGATTNVGAATALGAAAVASGVNNTVNEVGKFFKRW